LPSIEVPGGASPNNKETAMATTTKQENKQTTPFFNEQILQDFHFNDWSDRLKSIGQVQTNTARQIADHALAYGRHMSEQLGTNMEYAARMTREGLDYTITMMDAWNKMWFDTTKNAVDQLTHKE